MRCEPPAPLLPSSKKLIWMAMCPVPLLLLQSAQGNHLCGAAGMCLQWDGRSTLGKNPPGKHVGPYQRRSWGEAGVESEVREVWGAVWELQGSGGRAGCGGSGGVGWAREGDLSPHWGWRKRLGTRPAGCWQCHLDGLVPLKRLCCPPARL